MRITGLSKRANIIVKPILTFDNHGMTDLEETLIDFLFDSSGDWDVKRLRALAKLPNYLGEELGGKAWHFLTLELII